jgi:ribonuclease P protein component
MVLIVLASQKGYPRIGITASQTVGNAVQRNRAKRLIRAAMSTVDLAELSGWDVVIIARKPMRQADFHQTLAGLLSLLNKSKLMTPHRSNT